MQGSSYLPILAMKQANSEHRILILSPYHGGSHAAWAEGFRRHSRHDVQLLTLPARFWKWRMHGAAVTMARRFNQDAAQPDVLLATDMLDLAAFLALTRQRTSRIPTVLYMHENQLTYPLPSDGRTGPMRRQLGERDRHYAFVNYTSMLAADQVWFNSHHHLQNWFAALPGFLRHFPEYRELGSIRVLRKKSHVVPVGIDFQLLEENRDTGTASKSADRPPLILWNQRWEYDKNPGAFFAALAELAAENVPFEVALCGEQFGRQPQEFSAGIELLGHRVIHDGYASAGEYAKLLWNADVVISTAFHEFFGISILEAIYAETLPLLPAALSYPELIPVRFHPVCLYENHEQMVILLRRALSALQETRRTAKQLAPAAALFGWPQIASAYDQQLGQMIQSDL